jgi:flagellar hook-associated protein 1 FlgK
MRRIAALNAQLATANVSDATTASMFDERDVFIDRLAQLMDISVAEGDNNQINIFTNSGVQLVGTQAAQLAFNAQGTMTPAAQWNVDPSESTVGTLKLVLSSGGEFDLIANRSIRAGEIAALIEMRDDILVEVQNQLDSIAAALAQSLSDLTTAGTPATLGLQNGFTVDTAGLLAGNTISLTYTDNVSSIQRRITIVRVDDPSVLPLSDGDTNDPNDEVIGINFSGGLAAAIAQLNSHFNGRVVFDNPAGTTLRVLDDGGPDLADVDAVSITKTVTSLTGGTPEVPLFTDASNPYTGAITSLGSQRLGLAGRIAVNAALFADPSKLVVFSTSPPTASGDPTRPNFIYQRLTQFAMTYAADTGIGTEASPFSASVPEFIRAMLSEQGQAAANADNLAQGQTVVVNALRERMAESSAVNVDEEMANLLTLQTAYAANARVMSTVKEMFDVLLRM